MYVNKRNSSTKYSKTRFIKSSLIFLFIALIALISLWLPILFS
jgi:hypothetical protein